MPLTSKCLSCATEVESDSLFCRRCGRRLAKSASEERQTAEELIEQSASFLEVLGNWKTAAQACSQYLERFPNGPAARDMTMTLRVLVNLMGLKARAESPVPERRIPGSIQWSYEVVREVAMGCAPVLQNGLVTSIRLRDSKRREQVLQGIAGFADFAASQLVPVFQASRQEAEQLAPNGETQAQKRGLTQKRVYADAEIYYAALGRGDLEPAHRGLTHLKQLDPYNAYFRNLLGVLLLKQGANRSAMQEFLFGFSLDPSNRPIVANLVRELVDESLTLPAFEVVMHHRRHRDQAADPEADPRIDQYEGFLRLMVSTFASVTLKVRGSEIDLSQPDLLFDYRNTGRPWLVEPSAASPPALDGQRVFISYRRADSVALAHRIRDALKLAIPSTNVFLDEAAMIGGANFTAAIRTAIDKSTLFLLLVGPSFNSRKGLARLHHHADILCREIAYALAHEKPIVPILVEAEVMPAADALPESIRAIAGAHAPRIRTRRFDADFAGLLEDLALVVAHHKARTTAIERERHERDHLMRTDPSEGWRRMDEMFEAARDSFPQFHSTRASPGEGVPQDRVSVEGVWECVACAPSGRSFMLRIVINRLNGRRFTGEMGSRRRRGAFGRKEKLRGEWATIEDQDQKLLLGFSLMVATDGSAPREITIPFQRMVGDSLVGRDSSGVEFTSRNVDPRPDGF